jgi:addiction module HigA family antidote
VKTKKLPPIHPGEILKEEFMEPYGLSANQLAARILVPPGRVSAICAGKRAITPDTALRLSALFGVSAEFWMNIQQRYDLEVAKDAAEALLPQIQKLKPLAS